jgi:glycosyltransferase involved in cell wall biosynthesis
MYPEISVLMCVYNDSRFLRQSVDSILDQSFTDFEFVIIDDASTEDIKSIIDSYTDPRIVYYRLERNVGLQNALNTGLDMCKGNYIARMDSDDVSVRTRLERLYNGFKNDNIGLVSCYSISVTENLKRRKSEWHDETIRMSKQKIKETMLKRNCIVGAGAMYSRKVIEKIGYYDPKSRSCEDYNYYLRILQFFNFEIIPKTLYFARYNPNSYRRTTEFRKHDWPGIVIFSKDISLTKTEIWWLKNGSDWQQDKSNDHPQLLAKSPYPLVDAVFNFLVSEWTKGEDISILEVGAGDGRVIKHLKNTLGYKRVFGLDYSTKMLSLVSDFPKKNLITGNVRSLPSWFPKFDITFTCGTLAHIHPGHLLSVLGNMLAYTTKYIIHIEHIPVNETYFYSESHGGCWRHNIVRMYKKLGINCKILRQRKGKYSVYLVNIKHDTI